MDLHHIMKKYIWLIILTAILLSFIVPSIGFVFKPYLSYLLMALMFFSFLSISVKQVIKQLTDYKRDITLLAIIHLMSPLLVLLVKPFFTEQIFLGLILATTVSSGMAVVFLSHLYGGVPSKALVITTLSNLFSPITIPFLVFIFTTTTIEINVVAMSLTIFKLVIIPYVLASIVRNTRINNSVKKYGDEFSMVLLFALIMGIVSPLREVVLNNISQSLLLSGLIIFLVTVNFFLGYFLGKKKPEKITFGISTSYKNYTLSTVIALTLFNPIVALPTILYAIVSNLLLIPLQLFFVKNKE